MVICQNCTRHISGRIDRIPNAVEALGSPCSCLALEFASISGAMEVEKPPVSEFAGSKTVDNNSTEPGNKVIPLSQKVVKNIELHRKLRDPLVLPDRTRLIAATELPTADERLTTMGQMILAEDGGSLRTFSGNLAHENGWWSSYKRCRLQHWQGETQRYALLANECDYTAEWAQSEPCCIRAPLGDEWFEWYADLHVRRHNDLDELWEIKRDEQSLADPHYRLKLAIMDEVCRRIGVRFRLVMANEIILNRHHRDNLELFASRRFLRILPEHMRRFEAFAMTKGSETTYGELARTIDPGRPTKGAATIQALTVRRRVEIDLRAMLSPNTPLRIH